jgi:hypothetical protein
VRIGAARTLALATALGTLIAVLPLPAVALGPPRTLAAVRSLGALAGPAAPVNPAFPVDFLVVSWTDGDRPTVRFRYGADWEAWSRVPLDDVPTTGGRTFSALVSGDSADAYQVRGDSADVDVLAINTTDGPRELRWRQPQAQATVPQPALISRPQWGADESLRFNGTTEKCTRTFYPTQKLVVHHTVTSNADPDPAATVRAIYYDHVVNRDFCDIAYNFLIDAQGHIYKGRYSGPQNTASQDTLTGENAQGYGVTGAHTGGYNSGTLGVAILGTFTSTPIPTAARQALVRQLAWEADHHGLDPLATSLYRNPESAVTKANPNISGHRDWTATQCPGETLYKRLPSIRQEVAAVIGAPVDTKPPRISAIDTRKLRPKSALVRWRTSEPASGQVQYWEPGHARDTTPVDRTLARGHKARLRSLDRATQYRFRVLGWDAAGNADRSRPKRFTTPA